LEGHALDVQIFGVKKSAETRKALRFFSERRIRTHFVDFKERTASTGELRRFAQKFSVRALVDEHSTRYQELGLQHAVLSEPRWLELLVEEPLLLKMPLVRKGNLLSIGLSEAEWKEWLSA
jgi:arsenate reductase-like glutaredoxin family protein